jgi:hypothetical protein
MIDTDSKGDFTLPTAVACRRQPTEPCSMLEIVVTHSNPDPVHVTPLKEWYETVPDTNRQH